MVAKILTEDSKGTCPMGAPDCLSVVKHGQTGEPTSKQAKENPNKDNPVNNTQKATEKTEQNSAPVVE